MGARRRRSSAMKIVTTLLVLLPAVFCEQMGLLDSLGSEIASDLINDPFLSASGVPRLLNNPLDAAGFGGEGIVDAALKEVQSAAAPLVPLLMTAPGGAALVNTFVKAQGSAKPASQPLKLSGGLATPPFKVKGGVGVPIPLKVPFKVPVGIPIKGAGKMLKAAVPIKKVTLKKAAGKKVLAAKAVKILKKPKVYSLKPIVHVIEKPVPVFHKVPVPKKVLVPKFYPVFKPIPVPKIVPVPFKVPVKKIIPKIVKIPKAIPIPKFVPVKKLVPIGIPYPVPKIVKVPIPKPMPYPKFIPIPIPKKVPKFIPFPVKKIIKVPKPFYVPIKVPKVSFSYMKTPTVVKVPTIPKPPLKLGFFPSFPSPVKVQEEIKYEQKPPKVKTTVKQPVVNFYQNVQQPVMMDEEVKIYERELVKPVGDEMKAYGNKAERPVLHFIPNENEAVYRVKDANTEKMHNTPPEDLSLE